MKAYTLKGKPIVAIVTVKDRIFVTGIKPVKRDDMVEGYFSHFEKYIFDVETETVQWVGSFPTVYYGGTRPGQAHLWVKYDLNTKSERLEPIAFWVDYNTG